MVSALPIDPVHSAPTLSAGRSELGRRLGTLDNSEAWHGLALPGAPTPHAAVSPCCTLAVLPSRPCCPCSGLWRMSGAQLKAGRA